MKSPQALKIYECSFGESPNTLFFRRLFPGGHGPQSNINYTRT